VILTGLNLVGLVLLGLVITADHEKKRLGLIEQLQRAMSHIEKLDRDRAQFVGKL